ncbi:MAG TPA: glycoside hydrolase family 9 protein [Bacteroidales bacterium]|nr:glycoside hydrolase family 9 protein [Bacteroidales bacterium]
MKRLSLLTLMISVICFSAISQVDEKLKSDLKSTGNVHFPLPLDYSKSFETYGLTKKVLVSNMLCDMESLTGWSHEGIGGMRLTSERSQTGKSSLKIVAPTMPDSLPVRGMGRGTSLASFDVGGKSWEKFNRIHLYIYPECEGARSIYLNLYVENDGKIKVPDKYGREGYHEINLINGQWNECFVEMTELARDKVTKLKFAIEVFGKERTMGDSLKFDIDAVELQVVENPEVVSGWKPATNRIIFSTSGYRPESEKTAIVNVAGNKGMFQLIDYTTSQVVYEGKITPSKTRTGDFETIDFSDFMKEGQFMIRVGNVTTRPFYINRNLWDDSAWRVVNFMFVERCGYPVPEKHGACHSDLNCEYNGKIFPVNGGWHDAADMSQQALQTGEIAYSIMEMANRAKEKNDIDLYNRLMEESLWGIDFIMKTRLGDGYRFMTWGTNLWTDRLIGTIDDAGRRQVTVHNGGFENFLFSGIEAYASMSIDHDPMLKENLRKIAKEDFGYAIKRFEELGYDERINKGHGHAYMASQSQYMASVSWAASMLYKSTGEKYYADKAAEFIKYVIQCQRTEPLNDKNKTRGFFYRDLAKNSIVHYTHQSRDYVYMQALTELCRTQPNNPDYKTWGNSIRLFGDYLKNIMQYVQPYGMIPSGVYQKDEVKDSVNFYLIQVGIRQGAGPDFREQLANGVKLDNEHYLRVFPVWFSFKGNAAVHLSTGKAAALCGKFLNDKELMNIAEQQLFWIVGKNPFGQSLIWGEGSNYMQQYVALPGETVGEIPVGMQSRFNEDTPYWPQFNTATYKEVWGSSAGKWFSLISEF